MNKKKYIEPQSEVIELLIKGSILSSSPSGTEEGGSGTPTGDIDEDENEGF